MSIGMDIDQEAIQYAQNHSSSPNVQFLIADSMALSFRNNSFDVIVCNHIYEHVPYADKMMDEIYRVLKVNGFCYFLQETNIWSLKGIGVFLFYPGFPSH
jgi:ubiquinone/menaquinone biosynthesis C-methylase UbiE